MNRYSYTVQLGVFSGGSTDINGNPVIGTTTWTDFDADIQTKSGAMTLDQNQNQIKVDYSIFVNPNTNLTFSRNQLVKVNSEEFVILNVFESPLNIEFWVSRKNKR